MRIVERRTIAIFAAAIALLLQSRAADAGPPLLCHPLEVGAAELLPWGSGDGWHTPNRHYDLASLPTDMLRLLSSDAPLLARMENLRRATIYAAERPKVAVALLEALLARVTAGGTLDAQGALAWFDAGYLIETYRQQSMIDSRHLLAEIDVPASEYAELDDLDGYRMLGRVLELTEADAEIEFARSMMTRDAQAAADHRRQAQAGAPLGSLLARNLATYAD